MKLIQTSRELSRDERAVMLVNRPQALKNCEGQTLMTIASCVYEDIDKDGNEITVMVFLTQEEEAVATTSKTVMSSYERICKGLDLNPAADVIPLRVLSGVTRAGRTYYDVEYAV